MHELQPTLSSSDEDLIDAPHGADPEATELDVSHDVVEAVEEAAPETDEVVSLEASPERLEGSEEPEVERDGAEDELAAETEVLPEYDMPRGEVVQGDQDPVDDAEPSAAEPTDEAPSFEGVPEPLARALAERGFDSLTAVQSAVIAADADGRDLQISSQTGSGKTVAVGLVVARALASNPTAGAGTKPRVLILVPTRELAAQVRDELAWLFAGVPNSLVGCVTGGTSIQDERRRLRKPPAIMVGTPGRVLDHLSSGALRGSGVVELVLDEADQMLDMGFRDELEAILRACGLGPAPHEDPDFVGPLAEDADESADENAAPRRRTHLVSATFPRGITQLAERYQRNPLRLEGTALGEANADIEHIAYRVDPASRYGALFNVLLQADADRALVFVGTRADTTVLSEALSEDGIPARPLSGELAQAERTRTLNAFKNGSVSVLVATDVASRGLDVPDVELVIHAVPTPYPEVYVHRSGRTGRAGKKGMSVLLAPINRERRLRGMLRGLGIESDWRTIPSAPEVAKAQRKRYRRALFEKLQAEPSEDSAELAAKLVEDHEPEKVIALLLDGVVVSKPPAPKEVEDPHVRREMRRGDRRRDRYDGAKFAGHGRGKFDRYSDGPRRDDDRNGRGGHDRNGQQRSYEQQRSSGQHGSNGRYGPRERYEERREGNGRYPSNGGDRYQGGGQQHRRDQRDDFQPSRGFQPAGGGQGRRDDRNGRRDYRDDRRDHRGGDGPHGRSGNDDRRYESRDRYDGGGRDFRGGDPRDRGGFHRNGGRNGYDDRRPQRDSYGDRGDRYDQRGGRGNDRGYDGPEPGFDAFSINWGFKGGANPKRILAHICRRGGVKSHQVGAIRMHSHSTTFEIESSAAGAFESKASKRDSRDPKLFVRRER